MILVLLLILQTHASHDTHNPCASVWIGSNTAGDSVQVYEALVENLTCPTLLTTSNADMYHFSYPSNNYSLYSFSVYQDGGNITVVLEEPAGYESWPFDLSFACPENCYDVYGYNDTNSSVPVVTLQRLMFMPLQ